MLIRHHIAKESEERGYGDRLCRVFTFEDCVRPANARIVWGNEKRCKICGHMCWNKEITDDFGKVLRYELDCELGCTTCDEDCIPSWQYYSRVLLDAFQSDPTGEAWMMLLVQQLKV